MHDLFNTSVISSSEKYAPSFNCSEIASDGYSVTWEIHLYSCGLSDGAAGWPAVIVAVARLEKDIPRSASTMHGACTAVEKTFLALMSNYAMFRCS